MTFNIAITKSQRDVILGILEENNMDHANFSLYVLPHIVHIYTHVPHTLGSRTVNMSYLTLLKVIKKYR